MACSNRRFWRVTVRFHGQIIEDRRFSPSERITVGDGGTSIVLPGVPAGELVCDGRLQQPRGLNRLAALGEFGVDGAPDVTVTARLEEIEPHAFRAPVRLPWRELAYGASLVGCIAALLWATDVASAVPAGTPSEVSGRMERVLFAQADQSSPTLAGFASRTPSTTPPSDSDSDSDSDSVSVSDSVSDSDSDSDSVPTLIQVSDSAAAGSSPGRHSHTSPGTEAGGPTTGTAVVSAHLCDDPEAEPKDNVDVVFVIDVSTTMAFALDSLAHEITALDASIRKIDPDRRYGLVLFVDDVLVPTGNPYTDIDVLRADFEKWARFTASNRQLRSPDHNLDWPENGLDALVAAAERFDWRDADDTLRLVVYASDDDFGEAGAVQSGQRIAHDYPTTVKTLQGASVRVASFTAPIGGQCECEDVRGGFLAPYEGREPIPVATGGAAFDIDAVAAKKLHFGPALSGLIENLVCED
jgi:hypothetical protein